MDRKCDVQRQEAQLVIGRVVELPGRAHQPIDLRFGVQQFDGFQEVEDLVARLTGHRRDQAPQASEHLRGDVLADARVG
jgi:hypothetical protein